MSSANRFGAIDNAVCGSIHGDLYLFRFPAMYLDKSAINNFNIDKIKKMDMALTRGYSGHTSMILCTEVIISILIFLYRYLKTSTYCQHHSKINALCNGGWSMRTKTGRWTSINLLLIESNVIPLLKYQLLTSLRRL